jgi:hypothetical protein
MLEKYDISYYKYKKRSDKMLHKHVQEVISNAIEELEVSGVNISDEANRIIEALSSRTTSDSVTHIMHKKKICFV